MQASSEQDLLDLIYGAAVDPSLWEPAIMRFADAIHGDAGWLSNLSIVDGTGGSIADPMARIDVQWPRAYIAHFGAINPLHLVDDPQAYERNWKLRILTDEDWIAREELLRTEFYNDFLKPQNLQSSVMMRLARQGVDYATLNIGRAPSRGRFTQEDLETARRYHPHLIRAYDLGRKVSDIHRASGHVAAVLDTSPHGLIVLDDEGVVRHANRAAEQLLMERAIFRMTGGRPGLANGADDRRLQLLIGQARSAGRRIGGTMAVATPLRHLPLSLTVAPLTSDRFAAIREGRAVLICITDLEAGISMPERRLRDLFGLTGAEARIASALLEGLSLQAAAERFGISRHTAHVQLARVFDKTGTNGQSALVRLMMRVVGFNELISRADA